MVPAVNEIFDKDKTNGYVIIKDVSYNVNLMLNGVTPRSKILLPSPIYIPADSWIYTRIFE